MDFDTRHTDSVTSTAELGDLSLHTPCSGKPAYYLLTGKGQKWSASEAPAPKTEKCWASAIEDSMPHRLEVDEMPIGMAYCLLTDKGNLVWLQVVPNDPVPTRFEGHGETYIKTFILEVLAPVG
ncbi:hypothetical protein AB0L63_29305 [Nocardia sp. NPDC051990]|uniref:hypothetical protein n=1 Tax=Nocardia sp. NPDC051990 TaxID=3155285 RepID=UPI0034122D29